MITGKLGQAQRRRHLLVEPSPSTTRCVCTARYRAAVPDLGSAVFAKRLEGCVRWLRLWPATRRRVGLRTSADHLGLAGAALKKGLCPAVFEEGRLTGVIHRLEPRLGIKDPHDEFPPLSVRAFTKLLSCNAPVGPALQVTLQWVAKVRVRPRPPASGPDTQRAAGSGVDPVVEADEQQGSVHGGGGKSGAVRSVGLGWPSDLAARVELRSSHP